MNGFTDRPPDFDSATDVGRSPPLQIPLAYLFYGIAVLAATLAMFGLDVAVVEPETAWSGDVK